MIEKKALIDILQIRLKGGDAPTDVRGEYHPLYIQRVVDLVFSDMINGDQNIAGSMAITYPITCESIYPYVATLPVKTIGSGGVFSANMGGTEFYPASPQEFNIMRSVNPNCNMIKVNPTKVTFSHKPPVLDGEILMIPLFSALSATDPVILEENETKLFGLVIQAIKSDGNQEKINNSRVDG